MIVHEFRSDVWPAVTGDLTIARDTIPHSGLQGYRIEAGPSGGSIQFVGEPGMVGGVAWSNELRYLNVPVYFKEEHSVFLRLRFWEQAPYEEHTCTDIAMGVMPGLLVQVAFPLENLDLNVLYLPRTPGRLKNVSTGRPTSREKISCFAIVVPASAKPQTIWLAMPQLTTELPKADIPKEPLVDAFGQWTQKEWTGKIHSEAELIEQLRSYRNEAISKASPSIDSYGGWTGRSSEATGFFRREYDGERWWLVTPEGNMFFSSGINCVNPQVSGPIKALESLYEWIPPQEGEYADSWLKASYMSEPELCFSTANLIRAFGDRWYEEWAAMTESRMREWGFNTVANWSMPGIGRKMNIPYVIEMEFPDTQLKVFRDFPDVFSQEYADSAEECAKSLAATAEDPYLIGYFMRNEPEWGFGEYNIAAMLLQCEEKLVSKQHWVRFAAERYKEDIDSLNSAWGTDFEHFEQFLEPVPAEYTESPAAQADLMAFTRILITEYIRVPATAARLVDANHLNLGLRWAWIASDIFYAGSEYIDVFSLNCYKLAPSVEEIQKASRLSGCPVMIGEFHAGALDAGLPATGLIAVTSQKERGVFYQWYVEQGAAIPELVGAHYFMLGDQAVLGRFDGENNNIGLVDICHRPYEEMTARVSETNGRLCEIHAGMLAPTAVKPMEAPREGF